MRSHVIVAMVAIALIPIGALGEESRDREQAEELFRQAIVQFEARNYQQALRSFEESYELNPDVGVTRSSLASSTRLPSSCARAL